MQSAIGRQLHDLPSAKKAAIGVAVGTVLLDACLIRYHFAEHDRLPLLLHSLGNLLVLVSNIALWYYLSWQ